MKKYRNPKNIVKEHFNKLEKELPIEVKHFDYSVFDKANLLLREITQNLERSIFKGKKYLFHYHLFFDLPFSKDCIIIVIPVSVEEKIISFLDISSFTARDQTVKLKNKNSSLFIVVFDIDVKYGWNSWEKVRSVFAEISKKKNLELNSGEDGSVKFFALELPIEAGVLEYIV